MSFPESQVGKHPFVMADVACDGEEDTLQDCKHSKNISCVGSTKYVGVICKGEVVCFYCHKSVIALWSYVNGSMHGFLVKLTDLKWKEFISHGKERSREHNKRVTEFAIRQQGLQVIQQWDLSRRKQEGLQKGKQQRRKRQILQRKNQQVYIEETITVFCEESSRLTFKNVQFPRRKKHNLRVKRHGLEPREQHGLQRNNMVYNGGSSEVYIRLQDLK